MINIKHCVIARVVLDTERPRCFSSQLDYWPLFVSSIVNHIHDIWSASKQTSPSFRCGLILTRIELRTDGNREKRISNLGLTRLPPSAHTSQISVTFGSQVTFALQIYCLIVLAESIMMFPLSLPNFKGRFYGQAVFGRFDCAAASVCGAFRHWFSHCSYWWMICGKVCPSLSGLYHENSQSFSTNMLIPHIIIRTNLFCTVVLISCVSAECIILYMIGYLVFVIKQGMQNSSPATKRYISEMSRWLWTDRNLGTKAGHFFLL